MTIESQRHLSAPPGETAAREMVLDPGTGPGAPGRLAPLDALRGLIMALMALDHANHFIAQKHPPGELWGGPFPTYTDPLAFLTRLVTHLAAPGFFFLMGAGMVLLVASRQRRGSSRVAIVRHLFLRGVVLIALQFLLVNRAWELSSGGWGLELYLGVLYALGGAMILGSGLVWLRPRYLLALSVGLALGLELLHPGPERWSQVSNHPLALMFLYPGGTPDLWSNYPILPWLEFVTLGMLFGHWLLADRRQAYRRALQLGAAFVLAFLAVRALGGFGNIRPPAGDTWIDFLNVVKYPPSLAFSLLTVGVNLLLLGLLGVVGKLGRSRQRLLFPLKVLGRTPLFFYLAHLFVYAGLGRWVAPQGTTIPRMLPYWLLGLLFLLPLCWLYGRAKERASPRSVLRYL